MGQIKRHGNPRHPIRRKPFVGQPHVGRKRSWRAGQVRRRVAESVRTGKSPSKGDAELAHGEGQELLVRPRDPVRLVRPRVRVVMDLWP